MKTFEFKLFSAKRSRFLHRLINLAGAVYNHCIALHKRYYRLFGKFPHKYAMTHHFVKLKRTKRFAHLRRLDAQAIENVIFRVDRAYTLFFHNLKQKVRCSTPSFKKVRKYKSFTLHQTGWKLDEAHARIYLCCRWYRYFMSRHVEGRVKQITVKRDTLGDIYVYITCENQCDIVKPRTGQSVGFDFGLKRFLTSSDGQDVISPEFFKHHAHIIKRKNRRLSRTQKASRNHERTRLDLARAWRRIANLRKDFHYKLARSLCEKYAVICLETLNLSGMRKLWGRKINDLCFYSFVQILLYEAGKFGTQIIFVPQYYPSSQLCSSCGYKNEAVKDLRVREWTCPECQAHHDRDRNAAVNIMRAGCCPLQETH